MSIIAGVDQDVCPMAMQDRYVCQERQGSAPSTLWSTEQGQQSECESLVLPGNQRGIPIVIAVCMPTCVVRASIQSLIKDTI